LFLLGLVVLKTDPQRLGGAIGSARPHYLFLALLLTLPFLALKACRWYLMLQAARIEATPGEAALSLIGGMGLALVTPARLGELVRVAYLRDPQKWKAGGLVLIDKWFDVVVLAGLSIAGAWDLLGPVAGAAFTFLTLAGLLLVYKPTSLLAALQRLSPRLPLRSKLDSAWSSLESLTAGSTSVFLALTVAAFLVVLLQFGIILLSWRNWSPDVVFLTFPLVVLTNVIPLTVSGLGLREGAAAVLLSRYGVPPPDAALAAFLMFVINTALPGIVGALLFPVASHVVPAPSSAAPSPSSPDRP
jgi:uncharacterized membrane protein YbhN (UPF0104 family)